MTLLSSSYFWLSPTQKLLVLMCLLDIAVPWEHVSVSDLLLFPCLVGDWPPWTLGDSAHFIIGSESDLVLFSCFIGNFPLWTLIGSVFFIFGSRTRLGQ